MDRRRSREQNGAKRGGWNRTERWTGREGDGLKKEEEMG